MQHLLHKLNCNNLWKRTLAVLLAVAMVCTTAVSVNMRNVRAADYELEISNFVFQCDGKDITENTELKNGSTVELYFDWKISNNIQIEGDTYEVVYDLQLMGILLEETNGDLGEGKGTYEIKDRKLYLTFNKEFWNGNSEKNGKVHLSGEISVENNDNAASKDTQVGVGGNNVNVTVTFDQVESAVSPTKTAGELKPENGELRQYYTVTLTCTNGPITDLELKDTHGTGLGEPQDIQVSNGKGSTASCNNWDDVANAITNSQGTPASMDDGDTWTITYYMVVDPDCYKQGSNLGLDNQFQPFYHTNTHPDGDLRTSWAANVQADVHPPKVTKDGTWNADMTEITWTITIDPGDFNWADVSIDDIKDKYQEHIIGGKISEDALDGLSKGDFHLENGVYVYTYTTTVSDAVQGSYSSVEITNTVSDVKIKDNTYSDTGIVYWDPDLVEKTALEQNGMDISWQAELKIPDVPGLKDLKVVDTLSTGWNLTHSFFDTGKDLVIKLDGKEIVRYNSDGNATILNSSIIKEATSVKNEWSGDQFTLIFQDAWVQSNTKKTVTLTYTSTIMDDDSKGKTYTNNVSMIYTLDNESHTSSDQADWTDNTVSYIVKSATVNSDMTMTYGVKVDLSEMGTLEAGKQIILEDSMPEELRFLKLNMVLAGAEEYWEAWSALDVTDSMKVSEQPDGTILMALTLTQEMVDKMQESKKSIFLEYVAGIKDPIGYYERGESPRLRNVITGTYGGQSLGTGVAAEYITPQKPVKKSVTYTEYTAPNMHFEIELNPSCADLTAGDVLTTEDSMGSALVLLRNTIEVYRIENGTEIPLLDSEWSYSYDIFNNRVRFQLPDETHLIIRYRVFLGLYYSDDGTQNEEMTFENSGNSFSIMGRISDDTQNYYNTIRLVYTPRVTAEGNVSSITLYKFYRDENNEGVPLGGSSFQLYATVYNPLTGKYSITGEPLAERTMGPDENEWLISNLLLDNVYGLVETAAADGFQVNSEPYFFALRGSDHDKIPGEFHSFVRGGFLPYENLKETGNLILTKQVAGEQGWTEVQNYISFTVRKVGETDGVTYRGSDFIFDSETGRATLVLKDVKIGVYEVTETLIQKEGYSVTTTYQIDSGSVVDGRTAEIEIQPSQTTRIEYINTYTSTSSSSSGSTSDEDTTTTTTSGTTPSSPKTGDSTPVAGTLLLGLAGLCGALGLLAGSRRRSRNK